ncbi:hypothetical protein [Lacipirellula parvula]|nr:hypothetical protein [Lacipirellula parvula]
MKAVLVINLAIGLILLSWAAVSDAFASALASNLAFELYDESLKIQPIDYNDLVDCLRRATRTDAAICAVTGVAIIATSSLGLWLNARRPAPPDPGRESGG